MFRPALALSVLGVFLIGCDKIETPDNPKPGPCDGGGNGYGFRRVLIEDMTGFRCSSCPQAAEIARDLQNLYCGDVIVASLHVTSTFAEPIAASPEPFSTDFRTPAGDAYEMQFPPANLPIGMVSRRAFNGEPLQQRGAWPQRVGEIIGQPAEFELTVDTPTYNQVTQIYTVDVAVPVLQNVSGEYKLVVYLTEDSVADWQIDSRLPSPSEVFPYYHRHVLRGTIGDPWGEQIIASSASSGQTIDRSLNFTLPANIIDDHHVGLIAYVYRASDYEIMQVSERELMP
jgi:hypothetical protein